MSSTNYRALSGAIVTLLLLALVALILLTLYRTPDDAFVTGAAATATQTAASTPVDVENAPDAPLIAQATTDPGAPAIDAPPADPSAVAAGVEVTGTIAPTSSESSSPIAITLQPTPTRRSDVSADNTEPAALATVDPDAAPEAGTTIYANANFVNDLALVDGDLWTTSSAGARLWQEDATQPQTFGMSEGLASENLRAVTTCPYDAWAVVFASQAGLEVVSADGEWRSLGNEDDLPFANLSAVACTEETLAVGSAVRGVALYDFDGEEWQEVEAAQGTLQQPVRMLAFDVDGSLWVALGAQVIHVVEGEVDGSFDADNSPLTGEAIVSLGVTGDGALWVTTGDRLFRYAGEEWQTYRPTDVEGDYPQDALADLVPEADGRVWIISQSAEICRFDFELLSCAPWMTHDDGSTASVTALVATSNGQLAYGTGGSGAQRLASNEWQQLYEPTPFPLTNRIFALVTDSNGWLWAATSWGAQRVNPAVPSEATTYTAQQGVSATSVRALYAEKLGGVWLGGIGASYFDGATWTNYSQSDGLAGDAIGAITQDSQSRVWFGTRSGLSIWTGNTFFNLTAENGLPDAEILSLAADAASVWIGSAKGGLYRFENNQLQVLTQENVGLPSNRITALLSMPDESLYVGTDKGLVHFVRGEFVEVRGVPAIAISTLARSESGDVLVGTTTQGSWRLRADAAQGAPFERLQSDEGALPTNVRSLAVDLYDAIWIGTDGAGVTRLVE